MPACFQACYAKLAEGMPPRKASRAAHFAFWQTHNMTPAAADADGLQCSCDLSGLAVVVSQTLAAQAEGQVIELDSPQPLSEELKHFADLTIDPPSDGIPRVLREVQVITPGTYKGHTWTEADLREVEAAFDPANPPPIQMQHARSPGERYGRVRGLRLRDDGWLWALAEFSGTRAFEAVTDRLWTETSAGLYVAPYQELFELSVVDKGAVTGSAIQHNQTEVSPMNLPAQPGNAAATQAAAAAPTTPAQEAQAPAPTPGTAALAAGIQQLANAVAGAQPAPTVEAQNAQLEAQLKAQNARIAQLEAQARLSADSQAIDMLLAAGKTVPDVRETEAKLLAMLTDEQRPVYLQLRGELPAVWPTGRTATADMTRPASDKATEDARVARLAAAMGAPDKSAAASATLTPASK